MKLLLIFNLLLLSTLANAESKPLERWECTKIGNSVILIRAIVYKSSSLDKEMKKILNKFVKNGDSNTAIGEIQVSGTTYLSTFGVEGFNRRWDFTSYGSSYSLFISPAGNGAYYDFSHKKKNVKPDQVFNCTQIK